MADLVKLTIDGREVEVEPGTLIIEAARKLGIEIPTFCYDDRLKSVGACRLCLVEVEKAPKLVASCATPVTPGSVVHTNSEKVIKARKGVLEFLLLNHPLDCPTCDKGGECPLQNMTVAYGPPTSRFDEDKIRFRDDFQMKFDDVRLGPEIWMNKNRCIICFKCVRIARDLAGGEDLGIFQRGALAKVDIPAEVMYSNEFSGNTVEFCPVGALMSDSFRYKIRNWLLEPQSSVSWVCPDGANITVHHNQGKIYRHYSRRNDNVEMGFLSDKDRYCFDITSHPERILMPLGKNNSSTNVITYNDAIARMVHRINEEKPGNWGLLLDTTLTNEEAYTASEYFGKKLSGSTVAVTSEIDIDGDIPASSLGLSGTMAELETNDMYILIGCDLAAEHPILGLRVKRSHQKGAPVYAVNSRQTFLGRFPVYSIIAQQGKEDEIVKKLAQMKTSGDADLADEIKTQLKADFAKAQNIHILTGYDFLSSSNRGAYLEAVKELAEALNAKLSILTTETNYLGVKMVANANSSFEGLIEKIEKGEIKTLFVAGGDPVNVYPDRARVEKALSKLDFMIYWGAFNNETAKYAALVIPALLPPEKSGSYLNIERRLQFMKKPYPQVKGVNSLLRFFSDIKAELDADLLYYSAKEAFEKLSTEVAEFKGLEFGKSEGNIFEAKPLSSLNDTNVENDPPGQYPFALSFARSVYYGASGITEMSSTLKKLTPQQKLLIHPDVAIHSGYEDGQNVTLETSKGVTGQFDLKFSPNVEPGLLVIFGYSADNPPNKFMAGFRTPVYAKINKA